MVNYKVNKNILNEFNNAKDNKKYFGDWINNIDELKEKFNEADTNKSKSQDCFLLRVILGY